MFYTGGELDSFADVLLCRKMKMLFPEWIYFFMLWVGGSCGCVFGNICFGATMENDPRISSLHWIAEKAVEN